MAICKFLTVNNLKFTFSFQKRAFVNIMENVLSSVTRKP